jgi:hypothetical protein
MDISTWQYYTCPTLTYNSRCPVGASASWTSTFANRTPGLLSHWIWGIKYLPEFKSYFGTGANGFFAAPSIAGPYNFVISSGEAAGSLSTTFMNLTPGLGYTVVSSNPPTVKVTAMSDVTPHSMQRSPEVVEWELTLSNHLQNGDGQGQYRTGYSMWATGYQVSSGLMISDSHGPRTIPRNGLTHSWDMFDYGGSTATSAQGGLNDLVGGNFLQPIYTDGGTKYGWVASRGVQLAAYGPVLSGSTGYGPYLKSIVNQTEGTLGSGPTNLNLTEFSGNKSYTVAVLFKRTGTGFETVPIWEIGNPSGAGGNEAISLSYANGTGGPLKLGWGLAAYVNHYEFASSFTPTVNNWYLIVCAVTANGANPTAHMWVGVGGALVDEIAGVSRTATGGSPTATPNITTSGYPLLLGLDTYQASTSLEGAYGGLWTWSRALSFQEAGVVYNTAKWIMGNPTLGRGITIQ